MIFELYNNIWKWNEKYTREEFVLIFLLWLIYRAFVWIPHVWKQLIYIEDKKIYISENIYLWNDICSLFIFWLYSWPLLWINFVCKIYFVQSQSAETKSRGQGRQHSILFNHKIISQNSEFFNFFDCYWDVVTFLKKSVSQKSFKFGNFKSCNILVSFVNNWCLFLLTIHHMFRGVGV